MIKLNYTVSAEVDFEDEDDAKEFLAKFKEFVKNHEFYAGLELQDHSEIQMLARMGALPASD